MTMTMKWFDHRPRSSCHRPFQVDHLIHHPSSTSTSHSKYCPRYFGHRYESLVPDHTTSTMTSPIPADARGFLLLTLPQAQVYQVNIAMIVLYGIPLTQTSPHIIRR
jgi:hypothetical protein